MCVAKNRWRRKVRTHYESVTRWRLLSVLAQFRVVSTQTGVHSRGSRGCRWRSCVHICNSKEVIRQESDCHCQTNIWKCCVVFVFWSPARSTNNAQLSDCLPEPEYRVLVVTTQYSILQYSLYTVYSVLGTVYRVDVWAHIIIIIREVLGIPNPIQVTSYPCWPIGLSAFPYVFSLLSHS